MTDEQYHKAIALGRCIFPVASNQKRFANAMLSVARNAREKELTEKEAKYLHDLFHSYRRQMKGEHTRLCDCKEAMTTRAQLRMMITK